MTECAIYMKVFGLAVGEDGKKDYAGLKLSLGTFKPGYEQTYDEIISKIHKEELQKITGLEKMFKPEDIQIITPEEYNRDFGDD